MNKENTAMIQLAVIDDAQALVKLQKLSFHDHIELYQDATLPMLTQSVESVRSDIREMVVLKYSSGAEIIGSVRAYVQGETCCISRLMVHPDFQNQGIGKKLMTAIEAWYPTVRKFNLHTGSKSIGNLHFYQKQGYHIIKTEKVNDIYDMIYLEKEASQP